MQPKGVLIVSDGLGVNSVALQLCLYEQGIVPAAITSANPGSERARSEWFRDNVMTPWRARVGFPELVTLERRVEGRRRPRAWRLETLAQECERIHSLPSVAYGWKKCSAKYKAEPQRWWCERQPWIQEAWTRGEKVVRAIGYDLDEQRRVDKAGTIAWKPELEEARFGSWYPPYELAMDRDACLAKIREHFPDIAPPPKSACTFCPNNTLDEWKVLRRDERGKFDEAVAMSRNARLDSPDVVGLMRCNPHGKRQLHVWADGGYPGLPPDDPEDMADAMPCECAT